MNLKKAVKALAKAGIDKKTAATAAAKSQDAAEAAHVAHRSAKQVFKAARKAARAARKTWHQARDRARRDVAKAARLGRLIVKLEKKSTAVAPKTEKAAKPSKPVSKAAMVRKTA